MSRNIINFGENIFASAKEIPLFKSSHFLLIQVLIFAKEFITWGVNTYSSPKSERLISPKYTMWKNGNFSLVKYFDVLRVFCGRLNSYLSI